MEESVSLLENCKDDITIVVQPDLNESDELDESDESDELDELNELDDKMCWICHDNDRIDQMFSPCRCSGSIKYVHLDCLNHWRASSDNNEAFDRCMSCGYTYRLSSIPHELGLLAKYTLYLAKNPMLFYLMNQLFLMVLAMLIFLFDTDGKIILLLDLIYDRKHVAPDPNHSILFDNNLSDYYMVAVALYLIIVLVIFVINLIRFKHRKLYLKTFTHLGFGWWCLIFVILIVVNLLNFLIGTFILTILIQIMIKLHYKFIDNLNRAEERHVLPYDPAFD